MKESGNIRNSWTKAIEKTVRKFCTTASRIKKDAVKSVKAANIAIGISAITIGKMKLEQLKKKLPNINISIDYTRTWKDSLQLGLGIVTTGGGLLLTLAGGGSEIASVGSSSAISIPAAAEGIGIAGSGLAISFDALRNMFDVRIQKSESNKGNQSCLSVVLFFCHFISTYSPCLPFLGTGKHKSGTPAFTPCRLRLAASSWFLLPPFGIWCSNSSSGKFFA